jgi:hypothetical protein
MENRNYIFIFCICVALCLWTGCKSGPQIITDTGDFERLKSDFEQLRREYETLQSDYLKLAEDSQFYASYYRHSTEAIDAGLAEIGSLGTDNLDLISRLRTNNRLLANIIQSIMDGAREDGRESLSGSPEEQSLLENNNGNGRDSGSNSGIPNN